MHAYMNLAEVNQVVVTIVCIWARDIITWCGYGLLLSVPSSSRSWTGAQFISSNYNWTNHLQHSSTVLCNHYFMTLLNICGMQPQNKGTLKNHHPLSLPVDISYTSVCSHCIITSWVTLLSSRCVSSTTIPFIFALLYCHYFNYSLCNDS